MNRGKLRKWNEERGFGFISVQDDKRDVFIHISSLKRTSRKPVVGDIISFETEIANDGKARTVNATIEGVKTIKQNSRRIINKEKENGFFKKLVSFSLLILVSVLIYVKVHDRGESLIPSDYLSIFSKGNDESALKYSCGGKIYCSEMTSCEEAKFYQRNCPGTKMDGDRDGIPCETQWCQQFPLSRKM